MIPVNRPLIDDADMSAVTRSLKETYVSGEAPSVSEFEGKFAERIGSKHAVAVSSGTTAIDLCINALEINSHSHVVAPTFTIISTVSEALRREATIELIDADPITWSMNATFAAETIDAKTSMVIPVHIYGLPTDMDKILKKATLHGTFVLEDAAEALGVRYNDQYCGSLGNAGVFSFYANKIITTGEGGMICTDDAKLATELRSSRSLSFLPGRRFESSKLGYNARLNGLSAALGNSQLKRLDDLISRKQRIAKLYREGLKDHPWFSFQPSKAMGSENVYWVVGILMNDASPYDAKTLQTKLAQKGVDTRRFFCPIHLQPLFKEHKFIVRGSMEVSENLWENGLYLPAGLGNTDQEIEQVIQILKKLVKE
jgi:perosamine synthetase